MPYDILLAVILCWRSWQVKSVKWIPPSLRCVEGCELWRSEQQSCWGFRYFVSCRCVAGLVVPDVSKDRNASSRVKQSKNMFSHVLFEPQDEGTTILRNGGNHYRNERHRQHVTETSGATNRANGTPQHVPETCGTSHRIDTPKHVSDTSGTTHRTNRTLHHVSETSGTTHRTNGTPQHVSDTSWTTERTTRRNTSPKRAELLTERTAHRSTSPKRPEPLTERTAHHNTSQKTCMITYWRLIQKEKNCETQPCCTCCLGVRDCLMLGKIRGVRKDSLLPRDAGCYRRCQYGRRFRSSGMWHCLTG